VKRELAKWSGGAEGPKCSSHDPALRAEITH
jgi:hypothetical protein